jgi:hypothetical protein
MTQQEKHEHKSFWLIPFRKRILNYPILAGPVSFFKPLTPWQQEEPSAMLPGLFSDSY